MKKLLIIAALLLAQNAQATEASKPLTLQQQIAIDAARDPYAETKNTPIKYQIKQTTTTEGYIPPAAAEQMRPAKYLKLKKGNTVIQ